MPMMLAGSGSADRCHPGSSATNPERQAGTSEAKQAKMLLSTLASFYFLQERIGALFSSQREAGRFNYEFTLSYLGV